MTPQHADEIAANLERAEEAIRAARQLASGGYYDPAASRAYYAAFYAATALLLQEGLELGKHSAVIATIHQRFVRTGSRNSDEPWRLWAEWILVLAPQDPAAEDHVAALVAPHQD